MQLASSQTFILLNLSTVFPIFEAELLDLSTQDFWPREVSSISASQVAK